MKTSGARSLSVFLLLCSFPLPSARAGDVVVTRTSEGLTVRASRVTREIRFAHGHPSAVIPSSYVVAGKGNLFSGAPGIRWFELPVNGRVLTNRDSCWTFDGE